ncbi:MAG: hypothetical protein IH934_04415 [Nanoarchaeota archaeon]|nr:hypothetical protein [Nanoarchaeota archaeon]
MVNKNISVIGKKLDIFLNKFDNSIKVGAIMLNEKDLKSEASFIIALQKVNNVLNDGTYTVHHNESLFARFDVKKRGIELHKWSENTGILMPCWNYFKE